jgi:hypothetical protein
VKRSEINHEGQDSRERDNEKNDNPKDRDIFVRRRLHDQEKLSGMEVYRKKRLTAALLIVWRHCSVTLAREHSKTPVLGILCEHITSARC